MIGLIEILEVIPVIGIYVSMRKEKFYGKSVIRKFPIAMLIYHVSSAIFIAMLFA